MIFTHQQGKVNPNEICLRGPGSQNSLGQEGDLQPIEEESRGQSI